MTLDLRDLGSPTYSTAATGGEGSFRKGLRSGSTLAMGQMHALAGRTAETLGADDFASKQYAASAEAQQQAANEAPEINDWHQIRGLRDTGSYLAGQAGQMAPMLLAGAVGAKLAPKSLLGATIKGTPRALLGATAATVPLTVGDAIERQQANPEAMKSSLLDRNLTAGGSGLVEAAASNVVPQFFGGKLLGRGVENIAVKEGEHAIAQASKKAILAKNLSEGVVGQGLTSAGIEGLHQAEETHFDPNRDKSLDNQRMLDAGVTGAIVGAPFGAVGAVGELAHRRSPTGDGNMFTHMRDKATDAITKEDGSIGIDLGQSKDYATHAFNNVISKFKNSKEAVDLSAARDISSGKDTISSIDPEILAQASPEAQQAMVDNAETSRLNQVTKMAQELYKDKTLSPESRTRLDEMNGDFKSTANQMVVSGMRIAQENTKKVSSVVENAYQHLSDQYSKLFKDDPKNKSEMGEGIRQVVSETVMPFLQEHRPDILGNAKDIQRIGDSIRMIAAMSTKSDVDMQGIRYLHSIFGGSVLRDMVSQVHEAVNTDADPAATKNFMKMLGKLQKEEVTSDTLQRSVEKSYDPEILKQKLKQDPDFIRTMVDGIRSHVDESAYRNVSKERADLNKVDFSLGMQREFGDKSKSLLAAFAKEAELNSVKSSRKGGLEEAIAEGDLHEGENLADHHEQPKYFGVGDGERPGLLDHPNDHRMKYNSESPAERILKKAQRENPDHNVEMVRHEDLPPDIQANYPDGKGKVLVRAEGMKHEGRMSPKDLQDVAVDTSMTSHRNSPSRIDTGVKGAAIDARKLVKMYQSETRTPYNESDGKGDLHRLSRVFMEGIAAVQDHLGKSFEVPDSTVVGMKGKREITWGELKELKFAPEDKVSSDITEFLHDATHAEMKRELKNIQAELDAHDAAVRKKIDEAKLWEGDTVPFNVRKTVRESMETPEIAQFRKDFFQVSKAIETFGEVNDLAETEGKMEISPDDNTHKSRVSAGVDYKEAYKGKGLPEPLSKTEQNLVNRTNMDGTAIPRTDFVKRASQVDNIVATDAKIKERITKMGQSPVNGMREMAEKLRGLRKLEVYKTMSKADRDQLGAEIMMAKKASDLKSIVEKMSKKYLSDSPADHVEPSQFGGSKLKKTETSGVKSSEGDVSHSRQIPGVEHITPQERSAVEKMIKGSLGDNVRVEFSKMLHAGDYERAKDQAGLTHDLIRLSVHNLDPMSVGFHETLHGFIQHMREADLHGVNKALYQAADSIYVRGKLREFLKNEPDALKQIDGEYSSTEERAAYMYQMWAAGKLEVHEAPRNVLERISDFIRKTLGMWTANERAENIMQYLNSGAYAREGLGDRSAVARALLEKGTNNTFETIKKTLEPLVRISDNIISTGDNVLAKMENPAIDKIRKLINANTDDEGAGTGWISASRIARTQELNGLMSALAKTNATVEHMRQAIEQLQSGIPASSPEARLLASERGPIRSMLDRLHAYVKESGVDLGDRGKGAGYFPVVWDTSYIASNQKAFRAMLDKYVRSGDISNPDRVIKSLLSNDGNDFGIETNRPGAEFAKKRTLDFITPEDRAEFLQKDLLATMSSYVTQITRRSEWAKRFGDKSEVLNKLMTEAQQKHGANDKEIAAVDNFIKGVDGSLGDTIDPGLRRLFGNAIVYQNIRLLPFAVFSMAVDPGGIMVRGGTMKDAFTAFKRGITEIKRGFDKNPSKDEWYQMAETMGVIDNATLVHTLGTSYSQGMVGDTGRKINDAFFRFNLVEQMNTSMRVAAVPAALKFMAKHADGTADTHSRRWLAELDLRPNDVVVKDGKPLTTQAEFESRGMSSENALAAEVRMRLAVNKWVDGAVLRPNAAHKPGWMNDPHFALVAHLKQFVFSFNETIIKRVINEAKYGNYTPAYAVASYIPTMMAADFIKGMIVGGGSQPTYKDNWDIGDYISSGVQRSGLLMTSQFGIDAYKNVKMGGSGLTALLGPQIEQLADGVKTLGGHESGSSFALDAAPISPIVKAISRSGVSKADPNFAD